MEKDTAFFEQMVKSLVELEPHLEEHYKKNDIENFNKVKRNMLALQSKISEVINDI